MYKFAGRVLNGEGFFVFVRVALRAPAAALTTVRPLARSARTSHNPREKVSYESQRRGRPAVARATRSILCVTPGCHSVNQAVSCVYQFLNFPRVHYVTTF